MRQSSINNIMKREIEMKIRNVLFHHRFHLMRDEKKNKKQTYMWCLLDWFRLIQPMSMSVFRLNYCSVVKICNREVENGLWFWAAYRDHVFPPIKPNHCSKIADALPHNLRSTTVTSLDDHLWWCILERHMHIAISKRKSIRFRKFNHFCFSKPPNEYIFTSAAMRHNPFNSPISSSHRAVVICSFFQPPSGSSCMWVWH